MEFKIKESVNVRKCCRNKEQCLGSEMEKNVAATPHSSAPDMQRRRQMNYHLRDDISQGD